MDQAARILIIEDDADINEVVATYLAKQGYACTQAFSGSEARWVLGTYGTAASSAGTATSAISAAADTIAEGTTNNPRATTASASPPSAIPAAFDLVITDLMLPGASGEDLVREIRAHSNAPIIVVSARNDARDKVELLKLGADDYITKPFDLEELHARIVVQLRHAARGNAGECPNNETRLLRYKDWIIDTEARTLTAAGVPVKLTRLEYNIVEVLVRRPKKVFSKQELFETAWSEACFVEEKVVNVHVSNIRTKLKASGTDGYIETVWGIGFKLAD